MADGHPFGPVHEVPGAKANTGGGTAAKNSNREENKTNYNLASLEIMLCG